MKANVKQQSVKKFRKNEVSLKKKSVTNVTPSLSKQATQTYYLKIKNSVKRRSKQALRDMLLSKLFHTGFKIVMGVLLFSGVSYGLYSYYNPTLKNDVVVSKSEIVDRVSKLTTIPEGEPDAVVRVQDPETLKKQNIFYTNVKEGDYIVMFPKMAVIYDLRNNSIVAEKRTDK